MKQLKIILGIVYPILIILLLLLYSNRCSRWGDETEDYVDPATLVEQAQQTGQSGNLKITLLWNFQGDIDLHVTQPNGKTIYYDDSKDTSTGGFLDIDNRNGGNGAAENIFWENPPKGEYHVNLVYYQGSQSTGLAESGTCSVVIFQQGKSPQTYQIEMNHVEEVKDVVTLNIQ